MQLVATYKAQGGSVGGCSGESFKVPLSEFDLLKKKPPPSTAMQILISLFLFTRTVHRKLYAAATAILPLYSLSELSDQITNFNPSHSINTISETTPKITSSA
ncbi:hypothetical protein EAF00_008991 [Botryotinia globosa]|nr:hypothetical protein EAF00_008991 [Botryotinia globosa]